MEATARKRLFEEAHARIGQRIREAFEDKFAEAVEVGEAEIHVNDSGTIVAGCVVEDNPIGNLRQFADAHHRAAGACWMTWAIDALPKFNTAEIEAMRATEAPPWLDQQNIVHTFRAPTT